MSKRFPGCLVVAVVSCAVFFLSGCALEATAPASVFVQNGAALQGNVHGGQQAIVGAHVYLFAAGTTGYGGKGIAAGDGSGVSTDNRSISLLSSAVTTNNPGRSGHDSNGYYVTTDGSGSFSITNDYTCTTGQQIYIYALGGNPGAGTNTAAGMMAAIGECTTLKPSSYFWINEVSTVAAAYAMAGFASDATHVSSSATALAKVGVGNAFKNASNIAILNTGVAVQTAGNLTAPYKQVNSLANILASCVNSTGTASTPCSALFGAATSTGAAGGTAAGDTATAAIYIAQNPAANVHTLWTVPAPAAAFGPALNAEPKDWIVALAFTGGGMNIPSDLAIDGLGDVWVGNSDANNISGFNSLGVDLSTGSGFAYYASPASLSALAIDSSNHIWAGSYQTPAGLIEFDSTGSPIAISSSSDYVSGAKFMAFDDLAQLWITHNNTHITNFVTGPLGTQVDDVIAGLNSWDIQYDNFSGFWVSNYAPVGYVGGLSYPGVFTKTATSTYDDPTGVSFDHGRNMWVTYGGTNSAVAKFGPASIATTTKTLLGSTTSGSLQQPTSVAVDSAGYAWVGSGNGVSEFDASVTPITSNAAFTGGVTFHVQRIAVDGSGNVWAVDGINNKLVELVGAASPVVTPIVANILSPYSVPASRP